VPWENNEKKVSVLKNPMQLVSSLGCGVLLDFTLSIKVKLLVADCR
jgi:hypothetical protein